VWHFVNGFTRAVFIDLGKTPRDNDLLTIFVLIRTSRHPFKGLVDIGSTAQQALDEPFSNCQISVFVRGSNVSMMNTKESSTNGIPCDMVLEGNPSCLFNLLTDDVIKTMIHIYFSELIIFGNTV